MYNFVPLSVFAAVKKRKNHKKKKKSDMRPDKLLESLTGVLNLVTGSRLRKTIP